MKDDLVHIREGYPADVTDEFGAVQILRSNVKMIKVTISIFVQTRYSYNIN